VSELSIEWNNISVDAVESSSLLEYQLFKNGKERSTQALTSSKDVKRVASGYATLAFSTLVIEANRAAPKASSASGRISDIQLRLNCIQQWIPPHLPVSLSVFSLSGITSQ